MKAAAFIIFACFITSNFGLTCYSSVGRNIYGNKHCHSSDRFCAKMSVYDPHHLPTDFPKYFQGCSHELRHVYGVNCDGYGNQRVNNGIGMGEWYGNLYCCNSNFCNSASTVKVIVTVIFVILINVFIFV